MTTTQSEASDKGNINNNKQQRGQPGEQLSSELVNVEDYNSIKDSCNDDLNKTHFKRGSKLTANSDDFLRSSFGEIKFVIRSVVQNQTKSEVNYNNNNNNNHNCDAPSTLKKFNNNTSNSFDQSFEYKPINRGKSDIDVLNTYRNEFLRNNRIDEFDLNRNKQQNDEVIASDSNKKQKIFYVSSPLFNKRLPSSTPIKPIDSVKMLDKKPSMNIDFTAASVPTPPITTAITTTTTTIPYKLNLLTPPADTIFIDSDFESMEQDKYESSMSPNLSPDTSSDEKNHKAVDVSAATTPKQEVRLSRGARIVKAFSSTRRKKFRQSADTAEAVVGKKNEIPTLAVMCAPLTKENVEKYVEKTADDHHSEAMLNIDLNKTIEWGNNYDFSFVCEPATSDCDDDYDNEDSAEVQLRTEPAVLPIFKIDPPPATSSNSDNCKHNTTSEIVRQIVTNTIDLKKRSVASMLRRSLSDPHCGGAQLVGESPLSSLAPSDIDSDSEIVMESALLPATPDIQSASVRNLETISVSSFFGILYARK